MESSFFMPRNVMIITVVILLLLTGVAIGATLGQGFEVKRDLLLIIGTTALFAAAAFFTLKLTFKLLQWLRKVLENLRI